MLKPCPCTNEPWLLRHQAANDSVGDCQGHIWLTGSPADAARNADLSQPSANPTWQPAHVAGNPNLFVRTIWLIGMVRLPSLADEPTRGEGPGLFHIGTLRVCLFYKPTPQGEEYTHSMKSASASKPFQARRRWTQAHASSSSAPLWNVIWVSQGESSASDVLDPAADSPRMGCRC